MPKIQDQVFSILILQMFVKESVSIMSWKKCSQLIEMLFV